MQPRQRQPQAQTRGTRHPVRVLYALLPMLLAALVGVIGVQAWGVGGSRTPKTAPTSVGTASATSQSATGGLVNAPIISLGCGRAPAVAPGTSAEETIIRAGQMRLYRLHIPTAYDSQSRWALVLDFHDSGSTDAEFERSSGQSTDADQDGFLVAYPQGLSGPDGQTGWGGIGSGQPQVDDVLFTSDVVTAIQTQYCVDPQRIDVMGYARGGGMASLVACRLSQRVAAIAAVAGTYLAAVEQGCAPTRAVPVVEFHGSADTVTPYGGGGSEQFLPVMQWLHNWVVRDGCSSTSSIFYQLDGVTGEEWTDCTSNALVAHYLIDGAGHDWPHSNGGEHLLDATAAAWTFFAGHPMP